MFIYSIILESVAIYPQIILFSTKNLFNLCFPYLTINPFLYLSLSHAFLYLLSENIKTFYMSFDR